jgi:chemotaxis protein CheX
VDDVWARPHPGGRISATGAGLHAGRSMRIHLINSYVAAAVQVIALETHETIERGELQLQHDPYTSEDVTSMIGISGALAGSFFLSMSEATALELVSLMLGHRVQLFDELAQSGIAELANVVAGLAGVELAELGHPTNIAPPLLLVGSGARLSSVEIQRLVVELRTSVGRVNVHVALRESF